MIKICQRNKVASILIKKKTFVITYEFLCLFCFYTENMAQILSRTNSSTLNRKSKKLEMIYGTESINTENEQNRHIKKERKENNRKKKKRKKSQVNNKVIMSISDFSNIGSFCLNDFLLLDLIDVALADSFDSLKM